MVGLSLLSAFLLAGAATFQQRATRVVAAARVEPEHSVVAPANNLITRLPVLVLLRDLVRSPLWLAGWSTNLLGFLVQATALHLGSVALVQPLLVTQLLFTLLLVAGFNHRRLLTRDWISALSICAGVAIFLSVSGVVPSDGAPDRLNILLAVAAALGLVAVLVVFATGLRPTEHAFAVAVAAGLCFALSAVMTKLTATDLVHNGIAATAVDWPGYTLAATTLLGLLLEQEAFRSGPLPVAMAAMTITNPIASYLIGVLAFDVAVTTRPAGLATLAGSGLLLFLGTAGLAGSATVHAVDGQRP